MSSKRITGIAAGLLAAVALAGAWIFFAPTQFGGGTSYAILVGNSMEPDLHRGDLAVVREQSVYRPGDVVLYDSRELGSKVLHRIVRVEGGRFVLKGDNNDYLDPERVTEEQIVGSLWTSAPAVGRVSEWLRVPLHSALLVGPRDADRARRRRRHRCGGPSRRASHGARLAALRAASRRIPDELKPLLTGLGVAACRVRGPRRGLVRTPADDRRRPSTAPTRTRAGSSTRPRSPEAPRTPTATSAPASRSSSASCERLRVTFAYRLESERPVTAARDDRPQRADQRRARLGADRCRWLPSARSRTARRPCPASSTSRASSRSSTRSATLTGSGQTAYIVDVLPRVDVAGRVGGEAVETTFAPALTFDVADLRLQPNLEGDEGVGPFAPRQTGTGTQAVPAAISLGPLSISVATARWRVAARARGACCSLGGLALAAGRRQRGRRRARPDSRPLRASAPPRGAAAATGSTRSSSPTSTALARLAEHQGKLILHVADGNDRSYVVEDGGTVYRYRVHVPQPVAAMVWPPAATDLRARR